MFAKLSIPLLALAVTLGLAATPAEARRGGEGGHVGHVGGHAYHGHVSGHGYHGGWGRVGFYAPFWCPNPPYTYNGCLPW